MKHFAEYLQRAIRTSQNSSTTGTSSSTRTTFSSISPPPSSSGVDVVPDNYIDPTTGTADVDWSPHYVDYVMLKSCITLYAKRRMKLAEIVQDGDNVYLSEEDLRVVLAVGSADHDREVDDSSLLKMMGTEESAGIADAIATKIAACGRCDDYFEYVDDRENGTCIDREKEKNCHCPTNYVVSAISYVRIHNQLFPLSHCCPSLQTNHRSESTRSKPQLVCLG